MEEYMFSLFKKNLDASTFKSVKQKITSANKNFRIRLPKLDFTRKDFFKSLCKNFYLLEKLVVRLVTQKMKDHQSSQIDSSNYEEVVKKDKTEKKFRKGVFKLEEDLLKIRHTKLALDQKLREIEEEEKDKITKLELHETMKKKAKVRIEENEKMKRIWSETPKRRKPRFVAMKEGFRLNFELTEAQRTKSELAKKSLYMKILQKDELAQHARNYDKLINEAKKKREAKLADFSLDNSVNSVNIFKRAISMEREELLNNKKSIVAKRKNYGDIVRELFSPKIDYKIMIAEKTEKKNTPLSVRVKEKSENLERPIKLASPKRLRKIEENPSDQKIQKPVNYLNEIRARRGEYFESPTLGKIANSLSFEDMRGRSSEVLQKLKKIEKFVYNEENKLKLQDKTTASGLEVSCKINDILIQSVKAKVEMLQRSLNS